MALHIQILWLSSLPSEICGGKKAGVRGSLEGRTCVYVGIYQTHFKYDRLAFFDAPAQHKEEIAIHFDLPLSWDRNAGKKYMRQWRKKSPDYYKKQYQEKVKEKGS